MAALLLAMSALIRLSEISPHPVLSHDGCIQVYNSIGHSTGLPDMYITLEGLGIYLPASNAWASLRLLVRRSIRTKTLCLSELVLRCLQLTCPLPEGLQQFTRISPLFPHRRISDLQCTSKQDRAVASLWIPRSSRALKESDASEPAQVTGSGNLATTPQLSTPSFCDLKIGNCDNEA
ncbi:hypothetical protein BZA05DRAFT_398658 [Tricharina praecox]|uniref:uncharacterized protein n=1 Tax=Tricharina praecox TaxID=43433 RepID=UPI002220F13E|nr:uncharacterized protein BZA05DRAFT_398658 [Tricharina praecox]KAI5852010.1 hypothetical protein BZA05DRAFT_398658 [Tricharina praecox]